MIAGSVNNSGPVVKLGIKHHLVPPAPRGLIPPIHWDNVKAPFELPYINTSLQSWLCANTNIQKLWPYSKLTGILFQGCVKCQLFKTAPYQNEWFFFKSTFNSLPFRRPLCFHIHYFDSSVKVVEFLYRVFFLWIFLFKWIKKEFNSCSWMASLYLSFLHWFIFISLSRFIKRGNQNKKRKH